MGRNMTIGNPMFVNLPADGYEETGEGGMAFFILVSQKETKYSDARIACCLYNSIRWDCPESEVVFGKRFSEQQIVHAALLIGSTNKSLFSQFKGEYFNAKYKDLTDKGKELYDLIKAIYGEAHIVTVLDT